MKNIRILIVDDESEAGEILCLRLKRLFLDPKYVSSGKEALAFVEEHPVDIVLLDIKMPEMDGLKVLEILRKHHPEIMVIILSGHANMEVAAQGLELGAFSYQLKPINFELLCHHLEDAYTQKKLTSSN